MNNANKTLYIPLYGKASKVKNPINDVGVTEVYGLDDPHVLEGNGLHFVCEHEMTSADLINELQGMEKHIFRKVYAGGMAGKLYRMHEFRGGDIP